MNQRDYIELIKLKRQTLLLSQKELAKQIPISKTAYCKIENHKQNLSFFLIVRLAILLDIDLNLLKAPHQAIVFYD